MKNAGSLSSIVRVLNPFRNSPRGRICKPIVSSCAISRTISFSLGRSSYGDSTVVQSVLTSVDKKQLYEFSSLHLNLFWNRFH